MGARQTFILYFRNQKRRNYQWLWETFRMLSAGTFQFAPPENSVSDRPQGFVNYGYPGALPPVLENFCRSYSPDPTDCPCISKDGTDRRSSKKNWLPPLFLVASPLTPQACSWSTVTHKKNEWHLGHQRSLRLARVTFDKDLTAIGDHTWKFSGTQGNY